MKRETLLSWENGPDEESVLKAVKAAFPELAERLASETPGAGDSSGFGRSLPFASMMAHELKAPINAVEVYLRMMDSGECGALPDSAKRPLERSLLRLQSMRELVENVLALARASSKSGSRKAEEVQVESLCREIFESLSDAVEAKKLSFSVEGSAGLSFKSFPGDLKAVLSNLISNAIKYNRLNGSILVSFSKSDGILTAKVADRGIGISPEELQALHGDFARARNSETKGVPGSGLGLSIVRRVAALYGGSLSIESAKGEGSVFTAVLREEP